ncbi:GntR family transcriptional regulator [Streptosporangium sp. NPDC000239]|uniref:GntR family transcriptional regulator n=1 Tax=Streptosporangium sp. NPDC000239 TaxID=3154248 RepID=UPI00331EC3C3
MDTSDRSRAGDAVALVHEELRELILSGRILPGQRLTQRELGERLGVGRTPLREALRMLEAEGFVLSRANHGVTVAGLDLDEAEELYAALLMLQAPMVPRAAREISEESLTRMAELSALMRDRPQEPRDFHRDHAAFHALHEATFGPTLSKIAHDLYLRLSRLQRFYYRSRRIPAFAVELDRAFLEAMRRRDGARARRVQELHVLSSAIGLITDADPWHRFGPLVDAAAGLGITVPLSANGTLAPPVEVTWAVDLPGYEPVTTDYVVDVTSAHVHSHQGRRLDPL